MASVRLDMAAQAMTALGDAINDRLEEFPDDADDEEIVSLKRLQDKLRTEGSSYSMEDLQSLYQLLDEIMPSNTDSLEEWWYDAMARVEVALRLHDDDFSQDRN